MKKGQKKRVWTPEQKLEIVHKQFALCFAVLMNEARRNSGGLIIVFGNRSFARRRKNARRTFWTTAAYNGKIEPSKRKAATA